jgi:hypothetical protein
MMKHETFFDRYIGEVLIKQNEGEKAKHSPSGKLSAGSLGKPLQWQILHYLGVPKKPFDEYVLRKFTRGKDIEDWFIKMIPNVVEEQKEVEYRDVIGYVDAMIDTKECDHKLGIIPCEIKSVTNLKYKHLVKNTVADRSHRLQAGFYALATGSDHFAVNYVASDDLRVQTFVYETEGIKDEIDSIIDAFQAQVEKQMVPVFVPIEKWQMRQEYNDYPLYTDLETEVPFSDFINN